MRAATSALLDLQNPRQRRPDKRDRRRSIQTDLELQSTSPALGSASP
jgi:hypothetical protein